MYIYLLIAGIAALIVAVIFYVNFKKRKVFDQFIDLNVSIRFTDNTLQKAKNRYGLVMFHIREVKKEARALTIDHLKLHTNKLQLRSHNQISTKLPLSPQGVDLSVGFKKSRNVSEKEFKNFCITISGYLIEDKNKKVAFKKKLRVNYEPS
ncbi:hypothetical protein [Sphingobacterium composti Ten et al. 2007 non Yoo et al. 2007]|uniref:hypothetical protein n=1 Tax=Sphingobacterium composti TaxID=363260 RepID=UPI00135C4E52|nr:hypothetical protein [Sphingobacterium composti Ten et al. 2007 non Yoo et al. 2007]